MHKNKCIETRIKSEIESESETESGTLWKGKVLNYNVFKERLKRIWKLKGVFEIVVVDNGQIKRHWLEEGLAITCWTFECLAPMATVDGIMVWIRFLVLKMIYYDESFLLRLTSCVLRIIKMDTITLRAYQKGAISFQNLTHEGSAGSINEINAHSHKDVNPQLSNPNSCGPNIRGHNKVYTNVGKFTGM
ncbi:hypothetical protein Lal_00028177, partial [Lupinus albus]